MTAIAPSDIQWFLSNPTAGTGFSGTGTPGASLGKYMSTTQVFNQVPAPLDNLFLDLTAAQNSALQVDYQCVFMMNNTATGNFMHQPFVWLPLQFYTPGGVNLAVGKDPTGPVPFNQAAAQAVSIITNTTAPTGVSQYFSATNVYTSGLLVPDIPPQYCIAIWVQRTATACPPLSPQSFALECTFATNA